jgi:hypothetical protein
MTDDTPLLIRIPSTEVDDLIDAELVERSRSDQRSLPLDEALDVAITVQDVASAIVFVAAGVKGFRALMRRLRKKEGPITIVVQKDNRRYEWTGNASEIDDDLIEEVSSRLRPPPPD